MSKTDPAWHKLRDAVEAGEFSQAEALLLEQPTLIHMTNGIGETSLHFLAVENDIEGVAWLHARGADLNTKNSFGTPVLFEVAQLEYRELFTWFIENGADANATDREGQDIARHLLDYNHEGMAEWVRQNGA